MNRGKISMVNMISVICAAIFASMMLASNNVFFSTEVLMRFGARSNYEILNGEYYRLFMSMVVHSSIMHLIANLISLRLVGFVIEYLFGSIDFILIGILSGIFGSVASFVFSANTISVGASGIVFGMMGAHVALYLSNRDVYKRFVGTDILILLSINLFIGFVDSRIDYHAHIGGLLAGFICAMLILKSDVKKRNRSRAIVLLLMISMSIGLFVLGSYHYQESGDYALDHVLYYLRRNNAKGLNYLMEARSKYPDNEKIKALINAIYGGN